jgi:LPXTG-motif cell wall-anchored protein
LGNYFRFVLSFNLQGDARTQSCKTFHVDSRMSTRDAAMIRTRFLTSSLATMAVAATITLATPPANAADATQQCGQPAVTVSHPAESHSEWLWQRSEVTQDAYTRYQFTRTQQDYSYTDYEWTRYVITQQAVPGQDAVPPTYQQLLEWQRTTPDTTETSGWLRVAPADTAGYGAWEQIDTKTVEDVPAVTETVIVGYAFKQRNTGKIEFRDEPSFNGGDDDAHDKGWDRWPDADQTETTTITPAVTHLEYLYQRVVPGTVETTWALTSPGADWTATGATRNGDLIDPGKPAVPPILEEGVDQTAWTTSSSASPAGDDWSLTGNSEPHALSSYTAPDTSEQPWLPTGTSSSELGYTTDPGTAPAGDGWTATGVSELVPAVLTPVTSATTSAAAPDVEHEWAKVADSLTTVVDRDAWTETVTPATDPCPTDTPTDEPGGDDEVAAPGNDGTKGPGRFEQVLGEGHVVAPTVKPAQAAPAPQGGVLPNTGNGASLGLTAAGLGSLAAGAVLMMMGRRRGFPRS